jgi:pimeloyl-ACP methyl ester carboxylesterase
VFGNSRAALKDPARRTYVLVHGAWLSGEMYDRVAEFLRRAGCAVHAPTLAGNRPGDLKTLGLSDAINSLVGYFKEKKVSDAILVGHSYGGMVVTGAADRLPPGAIRRLVYQSAFVPYDGESLADLNPPAFNVLFDQVKQPDGGMQLPYAVWRDALMNDADEATARRYYRTLNNHPYNAMHEKIRLIRNPPDFQFGKSYIHCRDDVGYPTSLGGYHPRFSERLGLFRYVAMPGGHQVCFTNPRLLAEKIIEAGRD